MNYLTPEGSLQLIVDNQKYLRTLQQLAERQSSFQEERSADRLKHLINTSFSGNRSVDRIHERDEATRLFIIALPELVKDESEMIAGLQEVAIRENIEYQKLLPKIAFILQALQDFWPPAGMEVHH